MVQLEPRPQENKNTLIRKNVLGVIIYLLGADWRPVIKTDLGGKCVEFEHPRTAALTPSCMVALQTAGEQHKYNHTVFIK